MFEQALNLKDVASPQCLPSYQLAPSNPEKSKGQRTGPVLGSAGSLCGEFLETLF